MTLEHKINLMPMNGLEAKLRPSFFSSLWRSLTIKVITYSLVAFTSLGVAHALTACNDGDYTQKQHPYTLDIDNCEKKSTFYQDADHDGYGNPSVTTQACFAPYYGYVTNNQDCDDSNASVNPGMMEVPYNGMDDDCNSTTLDDDLDRDGYSTLTGTIDCNDADLNIHPGAAEIPYDGIDQDCSGADLTDVDGDEYDSTAVGGTDCNDGNADIHPNATELCDLVDNQCPGDVGHRMIDEGCLPSGLEGRIAFVSGDENEPQSLSNIHVMNADGSSRTNLTNNAGGGTWPSVCGNPSWSPDGSRIAYSLKPGWREIFVINSDGTNQRQVSHVKDDYAWWGLIPEWSPDGSKIALSTFQGGNNPSIFTVNIDGSGQTRICDYSRGCDFDWNPPIAWSPDGSKLATPGYFLIMNLDGSWTRSPNAVGDNPAWSPDGSKIAFNSGGEIYVMDADGSNLTNLTNNLIGNERPSWSPDGSKIAFFSERDGDREIYIINADGSNLTNITNNPANDAFRGSRDSTDFELWPPSYKPSWSPDGKYITFASDRSGNWEIYVMKADGSNQTNISNTPTMIDYTPVWSPQ